MSNFITRKEHFSTRHIGSNESDVEQMLKRVNASTLDQLIEETVPASIRREGLMNISEAASEYKLLNELRERSLQNKIFTTYIGRGYYNTIIPNVVLRNVLENPGWYTQYTPYQAEIAQGRLEMLLNFQTMVKDLTGLDLVNASLLDEATAAAEAMAMLHAVNKTNKKATKFFVSKSTLEQTVAVLETRAEPLGIELVYGDYATFEPNNEYFGALVQFPDADGAVQNYASFIENCHSKGVLVAVAADLLSLTLYTPAGEMGADVVLGTSQRFGVPMGYGGPHAGYFATREDYKRQIPGRIIGVSVDSDGNTALRMALQTREQHIKREKATSNICTAQALLANIAAMYAIYHGPKGLEDIANRIHSFAKLGSSVLNSLGYKQLNTVYFDTLKVALNGVSADELKNIAEKHKINLHYYNDGKHVGIAFDETTDMSDFEVLMNVFVEAKSANKYNLENHFDAAEVDIRGELARTSEYLSHPVFNIYHSETEMLRYLKRLENKDLSLAHSMIALGSCTMKLNATAEMIPITWPEVANIHPFVPREQAPFYTGVFEELTEQLKEITGFADVSLQPNAGAQGEYTGLMVIREYFKNKGEGHRNICLIPASAHGTNPASAVMAGMKVIVTKTDENGNIDVDDLSAKAFENRDNLAALMVTYPSTHGVFEESIKNICQIIHDNGGQVYMDGANMNAQVGLTSPGLIGADVCHLNLHKTFCIPHGGGGPGMGPIGVAAHLAPFLPSHSVIPMGGSKGMSAVSAAPWGSASILLISYVYIRLMGAKGLTDATKMAILNANYIAARLEGHYDVLYKGSNGRVAHELIVDTRSFKHTAGIEVEDIAKRFIDYGFHAPTISFPVAGTVMIEPTESESVEELDRFCDAMIAIREEIKAIEDGVADKEDNVLKNAPHTLAAITSDEWDHKYSRSEAAYPLPYLKDNKFWAVVGRVNNTHGDRNLICACPPMEEYMD